MQVVGVRRALRFSPNNEANDLAILQAVVAPFQGIIVEEEDNSLANSLLSADVVLSMARTPAALFLLDGIARRGTRVINPPEGVRHCDRNTLFRLAQVADVPVPPADGDDGYWLKRADAAAQTREDIVFCADRQQLQQAVAAFHQRGICDYLVQAHQRGDLVKFYGVLGTGFFRTFYPGDDGQSKFGDEARNGSPQHYLFSLLELHSASERLATAAHCPVYGGDAIIRADGTFVLIDFNDWPSFSRCRDEAANAIRQLVVDSVLE